MICLFLSVSVAHTHVGEECELTCRESNSDVVILPSNMTVERVLKEHWRNPHKVKASLLCVCVRSDRRTSQSSVIHNSHVRNFTHSVHILTVLYAMQHASLSPSFVPPTSLRLVMSNPQTVLYWFGFGRIRPRELM